MSMFGQVIPFRARRESAPVPAKRVHHSLSAALSEAGLAEAPSLSELTVEPEARALADKHIPDDAPSPADEPYPPAPATPAQQPMAVISAPASVPAPPAAAVPIPHRHSPIPAEVPGEPPLRGVIARAAPRPPSVADLPWVKSAQRRRNKARLSETASWLVTIMIMGGIIGVAATYLAGPRPNSEPVAQR